MPLILIAISKDCLTSNGIKIIGVYWDLDHAENQQPALPWSTLQSPMSNFSILRLPQSADSNKDGKYFNPHVWGVKIKGSRTEDSHLMPSPFEIFSHKSSSIFFFNWKNLKLKNRNLIMEGSHEMCKYGRKSNIAVNSIKSNRTALESQLHHLLSM